MDQITLRVPVAVKAKVTQALKDRILKGADQALSDIRTWNSRLNA